MDVLCFCLLGSGSRAMRKRLVITEIVLRLKALSRVSQLYSMNTWDPNLWCRCQPITLNTIAVLQHCSFLRHLWVSF